MLSLLGKGAVSRYGYVASVTVRRYANSIVTPPTVRHIPEDLNP